MSLTVNPVVQKERIEILDSTISMLRLDFKKDHILDLQLI